MPDPGAASRAVWVGPIFSNCLFLSLVTSQSSRVRQLCHPIELSPSEKTEIVEASGEDPTELW